MKPAKANTTEVSTTTETIDRIRIRVHRYLGSGRLARVRTYSRTPDIAGAIEAAWVARQSPGASVVAEFDNETWIIDERGARQVADDGDPSTAGER